MAQKIQEFYYPLWWRAMETPVNALLGVETPTRGLLLISKLTDNEKNQTRHRWRHAGIGSGT